MELKEEDKEDTEEPTKKEVKQLVKNIINSAKYLKKSINRLPKELLSVEEKAKIFVQYEELVDLIIEHAQ